MGDDVDANVDNFKEVYKYYKRKKPPPDLKNVLRVDDSFQDGSLLLPEPLTNIEEEEASSLGLTPSKSWKIHNFHSHPHLLFIQNPFTVLGQTRWIQRCLMEYPRNPNKTNLESHDVILSDSSWWELATSPAGKSNDVMKKLRWVTLGYHHNWDTKEYSENMKGIMPQELRRLCSLVAKVLGHENFQAEAAIINYYHGDSSLGPHTDHSEPNMKAPLLSFSFGQSAVFLIGGTTKQTKPTPLYLDSGDVLIMAGESRLAYHAVPKIVLARDMPWMTPFYENSVSSGNTNCTDTDSDGSREIMMECNNSNKQIQEYLKFSRINMNVRQVLLPSEENLS